MINNLSLYANYVYYITMLFILYSIYKKFSDLFNILSFKYFNVKLVRIIFISIFFFFLAYFIYDNYICFYNYEKYTNNPNNKFIKLFLGFVLLILKLIINKINGGPESKIDFSSLLRFSIAIISPIVFPSFLDYILKFEDSLHFALKSLISGFVQLLSILSILFAMVPALFQCNFLDLRVGYKLLPGLGNNFHNHGSNYGIQKRSWTINVVDNTMNPAKNSSSSPSGPVTSAPTSPITQTGESSSSDTRAGISGGQEGNTGSTDDKHIFKVPSTRNVTEYDSDSDTTQTWITTRMRRINKRNWFRLQSMYDAYAADDPNFPIDEHYESSSEVIRKYIDYRNKKTDGKITIGDVNLLIRRNGWNTLPFEDLCELSDDVDYELKENRKTIKWTKDDLAKLIMERNSTNNLKEKEDMDKEIIKFNRAIKSYKVTELSLRKEQLALNFRKAGITPEIVGTVSEESNEK